MIFQPRYLNKTVSAFVTSRSASEAVDAADVARELVQSPHNDVASALKPAAAQAPAA